VNTQEAARLWEEAFERAAKECMHGPGCKAGAGCRVGRRHNQFQIVTGSVIDVWSRIMKCKGLEKQRLKVARCETLEGEKLVGLQIPEGESQTILDVISQKVSEDPALVKVRPARPPPARPPGR
jgi:hypothetical protein